MYIKVKGISSSKKEFPGQEALVLDLEEKDFDSDYCFFPYKPSEDEPDSMNVMQLAKAVLQKKPKAVAVDGAEPTEQDRAIRSLCRVLSSQGVKVKLDTNGINPGVVTDLVSRKVVDLVSITVKVPFDRGDLFKKISDEDPKLLREAKESVEVVHNYQQMRLPVSLEIVYPALPGINDEKEMVSSVANEVTYCDTFVIKSFEKGDERLRDDFKDKEPLEKDELKELAEEARDTLMDVDLVLIKTPEGLEVV